MTWKQPIDTAEVARLIAKGLDNRQIADRLGCKPDSISRLRSIMRKAVNDNHCHA